MFVIRPYRFAASSTLLNGLVSYYNFDESSGNLLDQVGSNNGTVNGATQNVSGKIGTAYSFDGVNDFVNIDSVVNSISNNTTGAISVRIKTLTNGIESIFWAGENADKLDRFWLFIDNGKIRGLLGQTGTDWSYTSSNSPITTNTWHHVVVNQDGIYPRFYVDSQEITMTKAIDARPSSWFSVISGMDIASIGYQIRTNSFYFNGSIDELAIYNRALTTDEITELGTGKTHPFT